MRYLRWTTVAFVIVLVFVGAVVQATRLFRTERVTEHNLEFQTKFAWGYPQTASIRPLDMPKARVEFSYYQPEPIAMLLTSVGMAPSARYPSFEREWIVDWDRDGVFDLRVELENGRNHPILHTKGVYIRRSSESGWSIVTGEDANDVLDAIQLVLFECTDFDNTSARAAGAPNTSLNRTAARVTADADRRPHPPAQGDGNGRAT